MLADVVDLLACPHCRQPLALTGRVLGCGQGHHFDVARQGYVNLLAGSGRHRSDSAAMIAARDRFLEAGHYRWLSQAVGELAGRAVDDAVERPSVLDVGAGTGDHLAAVLDRLQTARGIATDLSVPACRRAARAHPRLGAVVADTWAGLPVADHRLGLIMAVFAPRNAAEFARTLGPGGQLLVVTAAPGHLDALRRRFGLLEIEPDKVERLDASLAEHFVLHERQRHEATLPLGPAEQVDLIAMGPNAFHTDLRAVREQAERMGPLEVSAAVDLSWYRPRRLIVPDRTA